MRVDQAIYGTIKHGYALRCASGDREFAGELAQRLDLPDTEPQGADWSPVTSGFAVRDRYVVSRTFSDPSVGRSGMVVTHALICDLDEIAAMDDLRPLLAHLITSFDAGPTAVEPLEVTSVPGMPPATLDLVDAARALVSGGSGPVVRIGSDGFENLMVALWGRLWPTLRAKLYFRLSFGPKDVIEKPEPTIVCTPASLVGRWQQQQRIVGRSGCERRRAAGMIDDSTNGAELLEFRDRIGAKLDDFKEFHLLEQAHDMLSATPDNVARVVSAARLIERLSPNPTCGEAEKRIIVERLIQALPAAQPSEILTLRNLALRGLGTSGLVWQAIEAWFERNDYLPSDDAEMVAILSDALIGEDAIVPWREAVTRGLDRSALAAGGKFAAGFWRWAKSEARVSSPLIALVARGRDGLEALEAAAPTELDVATAKLIMATAAKQGFFRLHAIAAGASMSPADAARAQSAVEPGVDATAMRLAMRRAEPGEILDAVACVPDGRVLVIAGEAVAKDPTLLARRDMSTAPNRGIWEAALKTDAGAWRGPEDPRKAFNDLLDEQIDGGKPPAELLRLLSASPLADLTAYPRRSEVWNKLPAITRDRLLAATKDAWFASVGTGQQNTTIEPELLKGILRDPRLDTLLARFPAGTLAEGLHVIEGLGGIDHARFRRWVWMAVRAVRPLTASDADLLGRTLATRGQRDIVDDLISIYRSGRSDIAPVLKHCLKFIGFFDRWSLGLSAVSVTQKWEVLLELAAELFPNGPDQDALWERSGGRDADLRHHGTGKERWRSAIRDIQNGRQFHVSRLIQQMRIDFPENPNLRLMADDPLFRN
ncbi:effector-associated domain EAD1-containing protein [Achromobacter sp. ACRQX]|uniref:GAP1-N1 domain-containing protein n=1 Tax=Achromobacter sp. ACRQX TaxID=2918181 RepID=UPI001EF256AD|nr:effector-associated domain EAD1-containing protein [Achromobacter sp. ACRQX]MCG7324651.1 effector-associated domain EAD1-containing protein [Achromobacter sp. ACRQX]